MTKRPNADISHHGPHEHNRLRVLHTAFASVSNLRLYRTEPDPHHHTCKQYLENRHPLAQPRPGKLPTPPCRKKATSTSAITRTQNRRRFPGPGPKKFKPGYWTYWSPWSKSKIKTETVFIFVVQDEGLYRNVCSATLDVEKFPYLRTTALWLRCIFAALELFPTSRKWLVEWMLYVQLQVIYYKYGYWEYHGGINALRWWKWTHPWAYKRYPARTARLQYRSQYFLSKAVQGAYYCVGKSLFGMKGDYSQYNPRLGQSFLLAEASAINSEKT